MHGKVTPFNLCLFTLQARRLCFGLRNCFSFMLSCQLVLSAVMFLSSCFLLPPPFTGLHLLWLACLVVPLLSLSLIGSPADPDLMTMMTGKNDRNFKVIKVARNSFHLPQTSFTNSFPNTVWFIVSV